MEVSSDLNPNAPLYVPWAYRTVEDFSEQWWELVKAFPWFRDYWLRECYREQEEEGDPFDDLDSALSDADALFHGYQLPVVDGEGEKGSKGWRRDMVVWGADKWHARRCAGENARYAAKAPKIVNVKVAPRPIQQPR